MNITKEQADKVIAALEIAKATLIEYGDWWPVGEPIAIVDCAEAISIMRGLADAEPVARVAEVHMSRYTLEWLNGPLPEGTELYTSPQAAQTEGWTGDTEIDAALIMLDRMEVGPHDDDRLDEIAKLLRKLAGRAGRKG